MGKAALSPSVDTQAPSWVSRPPAGRTRLDWRGIGWWRPLVGVVLYAVVFFWGHEYLSGVPLMP